MEILPSDVLSLIVEPFGLTEKALNIYSSCKLLRTAIRRKVDKFIEECKCFDMVVKNVICGQLFIVALNIDNILPIFTCKYYRKSRPRYTSKIDLGELLINNPVNINNVTTYLAMGLVYAYKYNDTEPADEKHTQRVNSIRDHMSLVARVIPKVYYVEKDEPIHIKSEKNSIESCVGYPPNTAALYNRGFEIAGKLLYFRKRNLNIDENKRRKSINKYISLIQKCRDWGLNKADWGLSDQAIRFIAILVADGIIPQNFNSRKDDKGEMITSCGKCESTVCNGWECDGSNYYASLYYSD